MRENVALARNGSYRQGMALHPKPGCVPPAWLNSGLSWNHLENLAPPPPTLPLPTHGRPRLVSFPSSASLGSRARRSSSQGLVFSPAAFSPAWPPPSPSPTPDVFGNSGVAGPGDAGGLRSTVSADGGGGGAGHGFREAVADASILSSTRR